MICAGLFIVSFLQGVHGLLTTPQIYCGNEKQRDEYHPRQKFALEEVKPFLPQWALDSVSSGRNFVACLSPDPCLNGGTRQASQGVYRCRCPKKYTGEYCQYCSLFIRHHKVFVTGLVKYQKGKTRLSFKTGGSAQHTLALIGHGGMIGFDICAGNSTVTLFELIFNPQSKVVGTLTSEKINLHCGTSGFDSFWLDFSEGTYLLGHGEDLSPIIKYHPRFQYEIRTVGFRVRGPAGAELMIDLPCAR